MRSSVLRDAVLQNGLLGGSRFPALLFFLAAVLWLLVLSGTAHAQDDGGAVDDLTNDCTIAPGYIVEGPSPGQYQYDVPEDCFQDFPTSDGNPDGESATADGNSQTSDIASAGTVDGRTEVSAAEEEETGAGSDAVTSASASGGVSTLPDTGGGISILLISGSGVLVLLGVLLRRLSPG